MQLPMGLVIASIHERRDEFRRALQSPEKEGRVRRAIRTSIRSKGDGRA
jgi:monovalent cation:H+ antiporter-2, CPA2 family